jgi:hypothetical protein
MWRETVKLGSGIGPHFRPNPGNVYRWHHTYSVLKEYYVYSPAYAVTDAIAPRGSSVVPRRAWLRRLIDLYRRQFTRYNSLAAEVIAPFVRLHVFFFPPSCIGLSGIIGHYVLHVLYDIVKDKSLEYRSGRSPGEHLATLVAR